MSAVMIPDRNVSRHVSSSFEAKPDNSGKLSISPRFFSAPVHAKIVAIGFVEVFSPFNYL